MNGTPPPLNDVAAFVAIVAAGGIGPASAATGTPRSTLSRALRRLEAHLGVRLARRSPKSFSLTEEGRAYHGAVVDPVARIAAAPEAVTPDRLDRTIRLSAPILMSHFLLPRALVRFRADHPSIALRVRVEEGRVDMAAEGLDLVVRAGETGGEALVGRTLFRSVRRLYASPAYLAERGTLTAPNELHAHDLVSCVPVVRNRESTVWTVSNGSRTWTSEVAPTAAINDPEAGLTLVGTGMGIGLIPNFVAATALAEGRVVRVLPEWQEEAREVRVLVADGRDASAPVRALVNALVVCARDLEDGSTDRARDFGSSSRRG